LALAVSTTEHQIAVARAPASLRANSHTLRPVAKDNPSDRGQTGSDLHAGRPAVRTGLRGGLSVSSGRRGLVSCVDEKQDPFPQYVGRRYVSYVSRACRRIGTLWEGRFKASIVDASEVPLGLISIHRIEPGTGRDGPGAARVSVVELSSPCTRYWPLPFAPKKELSCFGVGVKCCLATLARLEPRVYDLYLL